MGKKRINRCIELLEQGEYLYYTGAGPLTYENGKKQAKTWADFLMVDYEHSPFDVVGLARVYARAGGWRSHKFGASHADCVCDAAVQLSHCA